MREAYSGLTPLQEVDPNSHVNFLPLTAMYMGAQVTLCLFAPEYRQRGPDIQHFFETCTRFLYWSCFGNMDTLSNWRPCNWDAAGIRSRCKSFQVSFTGSASLKISQSDSHIEVTAVRQWVEKALLLPCPCHLTWNGNRGVLGKIRETIKRWRNSTFHFFYIHGITVVFAPC